MNKLLERNSEIISLVLILVGFNIVYGLEAIVPSNINWLMSAYHDWGQHYLGWAFYKEEPWHFPLGHIDNFNYPAGTNIGYTDSIPLLAMFFKLFSFILPDNFQYFGLWLLLCHLLVGHFTFKILKLYNINNVIIILCVLLISFNPTLVFRGLHPALCGHWLVIASIYYYLKPATEKNTYEINKKQILIVVLSALINPYLFLMVVGFNFILPFKHYFFYKLISLKQFIFYFSIAILAVLLSWYLLGMISINNSVTMEVANSYGLYSFNLNSFFNSSGFSTFFPELKSVGPQQYEGFAYLGLGVFILLALSILIFVKIKKETFKQIKFYLPLFILSILLALFAITNIVTLDDKTLLKYWLPEIVLKIGGIFRASGRFIWLFYYLIFFFSIIQIANQRIDRRIKVIVFIFVISIQFYDIKPLLLFRELPYGNYKSTKLSEDDFLELSSKFKRIITYPPFENNMLYKLDYQDLCFIALKNKLPITAGYVARETGEYNRTFKDSLNSQLSEAYINRDDLYIVGPNSLSAFYPLIYKNLVELRYQDGFYILYKKQKLNLKPIMNQEKQKIDSIQKIITNTSMFTEIDKPNYQKNSIKFNIEDIKFENEILNVKGWAFLNEINNSLNDSIFVFLSSKSNTYLFKTNISKRPDLVAHFKNTQLDNSGFQAIVFTDKFAENTYEVGLAIKDNKNNWFFEKLNQFESISVKKVKLPEELKILPESSKKIIGNIEKNDLYSGNLIINGWAAIEKEDATKSKIEIVLQSKSTIYLIETTKINRQDVTDFHEGKINYNDSGFNSKIDLKLLKKGVYKIGLKVSNHKNDVGIYFSDQNVIIK